MRAAKLGQRAVGWACAALVGLACGGQASAQDSTQDPIMLSSYTAQLTTTSWQFIAVAAPISTSTTGALVQGINGQASTEYLRDNAVAVRQDLSMGDGPLMRDLAHMFGMPDEAVRVGALLRRERAALGAELGRIERGEADATGFLTVALAALASDPALAARAGRVVIIR